MIRVVNMTPAGLSDETQQDSEPNVSVNPGNPKQIVATAFTPDPLGSANAPVYVSIDGGTTWTLNAIVPAGVGMSTADISLRFGSPTGAGWDLNGDQFLVADLDGDDISELVVISPSGEWIGILRERGGAPEAAWIGHDWVNEPGGSGASGWNLRQGDHIYPADIDGDSHTELVVTSPDNEWIGILREQSGGLNATWIGHDWVNEPGGSGASGWNLRQGDRFFPIDLDGDAHLEVVVVSPDGQWLGALRETGGALAAGWIVYDWVTPPEGWNAMLGGGILTPDASTFQTLRTFDATAATTMDVLQHRGDADQPYTDAITVSSGTDAGKDRLYVGVNDFGPGDKTATVDVFLDARAHGPGFHSARIERRATSGQDGPSVRPAVHSDGTVYAAFLGWRSFTSTTGAGTMDVVVVRDDDWASAGDPFRDLVDPGDGVEGMRVATGVSFTFNALIDLERIGSALAIAVDPSDSSTVYIAWGDQQTAGFTLHVQQGTNQGSTWSGDLLTIANATNPALAVNSKGTVGFMFQQLAGTAPNQTWQTHFQRSTDQGATWADFILADVPAGTPDLVFQPYLGDYIGLVAHGDRFYGVFCANNTPTSANFPQGVVYQRNADFTTMTLLGNDGVTTVDASIDPFFVKITEPPDEARARIRCVRKTGRESLPGRIAAIGGTSADGTRWELSIEDAIARIEEDGQAFFVEEPAGDPMDVVIAMTRSGRRYLKTVADGEIPNNLVSLPDCP